MRATAEDRWVARPVADPDARLRLFCFPPAGGSAVEFWPWPELLPAGVEVLAVQLPGRANRIGEPPFERLEPLVRALHDALGSHLRPPFAFFGHSLGALIAYELARRLGPGLERLYVAAHRAPQLPARDRARHTLGDDELVGELRRLNGTPQEILDDGELRELMLPRLRADFAVAETYEHVPGPPLDVPVVVLGGTRDRLVRPAELQAWARLTSAGCRVRMVPGDHFFLHTARRALLDILALDLGEALRERAEAATP